jgi:hypothetical protein
MMTELEDARRDAEEKARLDSEQSEGDVSMESTPSSSVRSEEE